MSPSNPQLISCEPTNIGLICLWQRELKTQPGTTVTELTLDHEFLMSSHVTASERALARRALELHSGNGLSVLIGGLGLGYTAHEALSSERVLRVEVIEYLAPVISWFEEGLIPLGAELKADPRLAIRQGDVYERLSQPATERYDLILVDVDHSPERPLGDASSKFYTEAGLRLAAEHLAPGGVFAVWSYAPDSPFANELGRVFRDVRVEPITIMNDVVAEEQTDFLFLARN